MQYRDLNELIEREPEAKQYFLSLPSRTQMQLQQHDSLVTDSQELQQYADFFSQLPAQKKRRRKNIFFH